MALFLEKGSVVSFGYIIGTQIQPYSLSSVETYLKFADAVGLTASVNAPASTGDGVDITSLGDN